MGEAVKRLGGLGSQGLISSQPAPGGSVRAGLSVRCRRNLGQLPGTGMRAKLSWGNAKLLLETVTEMRRVTEAPSQSDIREVPFAQMRVGQIGAATFQPSFADPLRDCATLGGKQPVQVPHGDAGRRGDDCRAESRFLQMSLNEVFDARPELRAAAQFG